MPNGRCTSRESTTQVWQPILEPDCHTKSHRHRDCRCYCFRLLSLFSPFYVSLSLCFSLQDVKANLRARRSHQDPSTDLNLTWTRRPFFLSLCLCVSKVQESPVQRRKIIKHLYIRLTDFHFPQPTIWDNLLLITIFQDTLSLGLWKRIANAWEWNVNACGEPSWSRRGGQHTQVECDFTWGAERRRLLRILRQKGRASPKGAVLPLLHQLHLAPPPHFDPPGPRWTFRDTSDTYQPSVATRVY